MAFSKNRRLADLVSSAGEVSSFVDASVTHADLHTSMDLTGKTVTVANASTGDNDTTAANTAFVQQEIAALVDSAPGTLNTLNELAAALGDDASFSTTVTNSIATKAPLANPDFTGQIQVSNAASTIQELTVTGNNTRSTLRVNSKDASGNSVDLRMHSLGDGPRAELFTYTNHDLAFATNNGAPQMTLKTDGKFGIGTSSPSSGLHLTGGSNTASKLTLTNTAPTPDNTWSLHPIYNGQDLLLNEDSDTRVTFKSGGNVGIGETSPANLLHVKVSDAGIAPHPSAQIVLERDGTNYLQFLTTAAGTSGLLFGDTNDIDVSKIYVDHNTTKMTFVNETSETMTLHGGRVGIGTQSPNAPLEVNGGVSMSGGWGRSMVLRHNFPTLVFQSEYSTDAYAAIAYDNTTGMKFMVNSPNIDVFSSSQLPAMTILDNKNVGIGEANPSEKLEVVGSILQTGNGRIRQGNSDGTPRYITIPYSSAGSGFTFNWDDLAEHPAVGDQTSERNAFMFEVNVTSYLFRRVKALIIVDTNSTNSIAVHTIHSSTLTCSASIPTGSESITITIGGLWGNSVNYMGRITTF